MGRKFSYSPKRLEATLKQRGAHKSAKQWENTTWLHPEGGNAASGQDLVIL